MLLLPIAALILGFALVWSVGHGFQPDETWSRYTAVAVLAGLDTVLGGVRARITEEFDDIVFVSGFFVNVLLAMGLVWLGERLGLEAGAGDERISAMMIAAVVVFSLRIFNNLAALRRILIERIEAGAARRRAAKREQSGFVGAGRETPLGTTPDAPRA